MFLRHKVCCKDGKEHRYWSIVENRRVAGGGTVQRHVLHLGEINDDQRAAWCQTIQAFDESDGQARQIALFPNVSERNLRPSVIFRKVTNGFRCEWGAETYAAFRSVVSTAKANGTAVLDAVRTALRTPPLPIPG